MAEQLTTDTARLNWLREHVQRRELNVVLGKGQSEIRKPENDVCSCREGGDCGGTWTSTGTAGVSDRLLHSPDWIPCLQQIEYFGQLEEQARVRLENFATILEEILPAVDIKKRIRAKESRYQAIVLRMRGRRPETLNPPIEEQLDGLNLGGNQNDKEDDA